MASNESVGIFHEQKTPLLVAWHPIFCICTERVLKIGYFVCNLRVNRGGNSHGETHKWLEDTANSFSHLPLISKAGFETIHMLWMSLLTVQHPIFSVLRGYPKPAFVSNLRVNIRVT